MTTDLIVIGGGEHGRVVIDAALSRGAEYRIVGYSDPVAAIETEQRFGVRWLGTDAECFEAHPNASYVLGVGSIGQSAVARKRIAARYSGATFVAIVHRDATVSPTAVVAGGAVVLARSVINTGSQIGAHAIVNTGAIVEHDVMLGSHAQVGPGAVIGGAAVLGDEAYVGLGACVRDHVKVGARAVVGMGAVVVADVADEVIVLGVPARPRLRT